MPNPIRLSQRVMSEVFWDFLFVMDDERAPERDALAARLKALDALRAAADYNTGSISLSAAWCLYTLTRHFAPARVAEVGTFIGKSTVSMASAMEDAGVAGEIHTCDLSNDIVIPWSGATTITQYPRTSSSGMLKALTGAFDLFFVDGRLALEDLPMIEP